MKAESFQRLYLKHRNSFVMLLKNGSAVTLARTLPIRVALEVLTGLAILKGDWKRAVAGIAGALWVIFHPFDVLKRRRLSQSVRRVSDREVAKVMYGRSVVVSYYLRGRHTAAEILSDHGGVG